MGMLQTMAGKVGVNNFVMALILLFIIALIISAILAVTIGFLGMVGLYFILVSLYLLWQNKGNIPIGVNAFTIFLVVGIMFFFLSYANILEVCTFDVSGIPLLGQLHQLSPP